MQELKYSLFENIEETPREHYTFQFESDQLIPIEKKYIGQLKKRMLLSIICSLLLFIIGLREQVVLGLAIGILVMSIAVHAKTISASKKIYAKRKAEYPQTLIDYTLYNDFFIVWISSADGIKQKKHKLTDIQNVKIIAEILVMEIEGQLYLMKKDELIENSYFLSICNKKISPKRPFQ